jgi:hypothetical protein
MKRPFLTIVSPILLCLFAASGCAYTLRYSVKTSYDAPSAEAQPRTFAAEHTLRKGRTGYSTERKLLGILSRSLENLGWSPVSGEEGAESPAYTFTVDFERPEPAVNPQFGFSASTGGGSGFFFGTIFDARGSGNLRILRVTASSPGALRQYAWSAEIRTESSAANLIDLARYAMPKALERFPEPGYRELKEKVVPRREASPPRR